MINVIQMTWRVYIQVHSCSDIAAHLANEEYLAENLQKLGQAATQKDKQTDIGEGGALSLFCFSKDLLFLPHRAVRVLFSPMVSRWVANGRKKFVRAVSQKP